MEQLEIPIAKTWIHFDAYKIVKYQGSYEYVSRQRQMRMD